MQDTVDLAEVKKVFPYGQTDFEVTMRSPCDVFLERTTSAQRLVLVQALAVLTRSCLRSLWMEVFAATAESQYQNWGTRMMT